MHPVFRMFFSNANTHLLITQVPDCPGPHHRDESSPCFVAHPGSPLKSSNLDSG